MGVGGEATVQKLTGYLVQAGPWPQPLQHKIAGLLVAEHVPHAIAAQQEELVSLNKGDVLNIRLGCDDLLGSRKSPAEGGMTNCVLCSSSWERVAPGRLCRGQHPVLLCTTWIWEDSDDFWGWLPCPCTKPLSL